MNSILRVAALSNQVKPADPRVCFDQIVSLLEEAKPLAPDIVVFPRFSLSSPSCGVLFRNISVLDQCAEQLDRLCLASRELASYLIVGLPVAVEGLPVSVSAVLYRGELLGLIPDAEQPAGFGAAGEDSRFLPIDTVFGCGDLRFSVMCCSGPEKLLQLVTAHSRTGCDLLVVPSYHPVRAGMLKQVRSCAELLSKECGMSLALCNGGAGDTSSPYLYRGYAGIYECGRELCFASGGLQAVKAVADLDADVIRAEKKNRLSVKPFFEVVPQNAKREGFLRPLCKNPYLPEDEAKREAYLSELYELQVQSLAVRMKNTSLQKLVLGVSGGLDSTLALLVCAGAADRLELPRQNIIGVTMPGFGTSDRTYFNALSLLEALGVRSEDISIRASVLQHFEDIGHDPSLKDAAYENAQARERAQILLDIANMEGGLVVGTGDLSEAALGWSTFAGDQIANYNVNICLPKTMMRLMIGTLAKNNTLPGIADILLDILDTPVSPELLPPDEQGEIRQKTEELLGPYALHDFFLYYFVQYGFRPSKLYYYACMAFSDELEPPFIREKLTLFFKRFFAGQFKRSCSPDSAVLTDVSLSSPAFYLPSDASPAALLSELESIDF